MRLLADEDVEEEVCLLAPQLWHFIHSQPASQSALMNMHEMKGEPMSLFSNDML